MRETTLQPARVRTARDADPIRRDPRRRTRPINEGDARRIAFVIWAMAIVGGALWLVCEGVAAILGHPTLGRMN